MTQLRFRGDARERALKLCGWGVEESDLKKFTAKLEQQNEHARAAAVAVFCLEIRLALQILDKAPKDDSLHIVAMALSGFSEERSGALWREMVSNIVDKLADPYLRAMFNFLLLSSLPPNDQELYGPIIQELGLIPTDRVAFCCLHLPDDKLSEYVNNHWETAKRAGNHRSINLLLLFR